MNYYLSIAAGVIQGLTEFLPISSTGHLILFENFTGISQENFGLTFDVALHLGTLIAILTFFYKDYLLLFSPKTGLLKNIIAGTIPAIITGFVLRDLIETTFRQNWIVAASLIIFSFVIYFAEKISKKNVKFTTLNIKQSFIIGIFQSLALLPGVSRSGSTISAGLFLNLKREEAAKFSFLLSGPIIAGAGALKTLELFSEKGSLNLSLFLAGSITSAIVGYLTIKYFLKYITSNNLAPFIIYRIILGFVVLGTIFYL